MVFGDFFRNKSVFITGHTGFKGAWLTLWLTELGARVYGYSLEPPTSPNLFQDANIHSRLASHHIADVRDAESLMRAVRTARPEIVLHLAAQSLVRRSYWQPRETYETNVMGTVNLLEVVRAADSVRVCLIVTSDKCYENRGWVYPYRENDPMGGADPYSSSKGCAEIIVDAYRHSFFDPGSLERHGVSLASARAGNVIGGGDWAEDRIIPDCIRALSRKKPIPVRNPGAVRPWQYVLEPLAGYLHLAAAQYVQPTQFSQAWNFGPSTAGHLSVRQMVDEVLQQWGSGSWEAVATAIPEQAEDGARREASCLKLDSSKAMELLQWRPIFSASEAIAQTICWYRQWGSAPRAFDAGAFCRKQITEYTRRAASEGMSWTQCGTD